MSASGSRADHVAWCKERALEYVEVDVTQALASLWSDLRKHPAAVDHAAIELGAMLALAGQLRTAREVREFIDGVG